MKVEGYLFCLIAIFLGVCAIVYWFLSEDPTGTTALGISVGLGAMIGGYCLLTARRMPPRPCDRPDAEIADGAGDLGHFSPHSYFPFFIAGSGTLVIFGIIYGAWLIIIGLALVILSVIGLVFENLVNHFEVPGETAEQMPPMLERRWTSSWEV